MLLSFNWLKDLVELSSRQSPEELASTLTLHTVEVESVQKESDKYKNVVVAKILKIEKHPNADKLQLATVDIKTQKLTVVCGAMNIKEGQKVPLAMIGAVLPNGMEIKEVEVRGVKSSGMLCAEDELGLGEDHSGIYILNNKAKVGHGLSEYLELSDVIFEVDNKSLTNRPDLWGHLGMAREISTLLKKKMKSYEPTPLDILTAGRTNKLEVRVLDYKLCPRYMALAVDNIKIAPSPRWIQQRLAAVGMRPINNIVDITNYVMLELGQPMHAFDSAKVKNIIVRRANTGEQMQTLDGQVRELDENMLLITDSEQPLAIAGIMGGADSEIGPETVSIILESANFNSVSIRKTATKLGMRTEASVRFEKSLDPNLCALALSRAADLIKKEVPGAQVSSLVADEKNEAEWNLNTAPIILDLSWLNKFIGQHMREKKVIDILTGLGFKVEKQEKHLSVTAPTWRATKDIVMKEDIAEEIARIYGYNEIESHMPKVYMKPPEFNQEFIIENKIRDILVGAPGLNEVYNYSFVGEDQLKKLGLDSSSYVRLANPIAASHTHLRQSLAVNLINSVRINQARYENFGLFELGFIYNSIGGDLEKGDGSGESLPYQEKRLGIALAGTDPEETFYKLKGVVENLAKLLGMAFIFDPIETVPNWVDKRLSAKISLYDNLLGFIYALNNETATRNGVKKNTVIAEISLKELFKYLLNQPVKKFQEFEKFPPAIRDLAFVVSERVLYNDIRKEILSYNNYIKEAELFDVYQNEKLGKKMKNVAFHIVYQADRTLTSEEVDELQKGLIKRMEEKFEAKVRDF